MSISGRKHIRWLPPDEPHKEWEEFTSTLVLTSKKDNYYTDLRIFDDHLPPRRSLPESFPSPPSPVSPTVKSAYPREKLAWAFAGTSESTVDKDDKGKPTRTTTWKHWIDSNYDREVSDSGTMWEYGENLTLEKGSMLNTDTNRVEPYEEVWRELHVEAVPSMPSLPPTPSTTSKSSRSGSGSGPGPSSSSKGEKKPATRHKVSMVMRGESEALSIRGLIVRVGGWCQGMIKINDDTTIERWRWTDGDGGILSGWEQIVRIGSGSLPCRVLWEKEDMNVGDETLSGGVKWEVVEKEVWD